MRRAGVGLDGEVVGVAGAGVDFEGGEMGETVGFMEGEVGV